MTGGSVPGGNPQHSRDLFADLVRSGLNVLFEYEGGEDLRLSSIVVERISSSPLIVLIASSNVW